MTQLTADTDHLAAAIDILWPPADDEYARAWRSMHLADILGELALRNCEQYHQLLEIIRTENLESSRYCIETPYRTIDTVNLPLLQRTLPDLFTCLVYIRASNAEKYLGRQTIYKLAKKQSAAASTPSNASASPTSGATSLQTNSRSTSPASKFRAPQSSPNSPLPKNRRHNSEILVRIP